MADVPPLPQCKWTWRVVLGWVPDPGNGLACPAEEHCDPPQVAGVIDGQTEYTFCIGTESPDPGGPVGAKRKRKGRG